VGNHYIMTGAMPRNPANNTRTKVITDESTTELTPVLTYTEKTSTTTKKQPPNLPNHLLIVQLDSQITLKLHNNLLMVKLKNQITLKLHNNPITFVILYNIHPHTLMLTLNMYNLKELNMPNRNILVILCNTHLLTPHQHPTNLNMYNLKELSMPNRNILNAIIKKDHISILFNYYLYSNFYYNYYY